MLDTIATTTVIACWGLFAFSMLQLGTARRWRGVVVSGVVLAIGIAVIGMRNESFGAGWLRSERWHSDAIALGAIVPSLALACGIAAAGQLRVRWATIATAITGFSCSFAGFAGIAIGRSGWYWEFVAVIIGGLVLALVGITGATDRRAGANTRLVLACAAICGLVLVAVGALLLAAWQSLA